MAANYADRIQAIHPDGPYHLLGWSFGGVVAHEVASELERRGGAARLVLLDAEPSLSSMASHAVDRKQLDELVGEPGGAEFAGYGQLLDQMVDNFNTNIAFYRDHEAGVFNGDVIMFSAERDESDRSDSPSLRSPRSDSPSLRSPRSSFLHRSWRPHVAGDIVVHSIDSTHQAMLTTEALSSYGRQLGLLLSGETM
jgi:thioesterase domain-containing protein